MTQALIATCALPPHLNSWRSLVSRSIHAWDRFTPLHSSIGVEPTGEILQACCSLDAFLNGGSDLMFWFFQQRSAFMSQKRMKKWSRDDLDDFVLLPASPGYVTRQDCFFVSHFWRTREHPDPDGKYLRRHQVELESQEWSYIWVDWSCMPQNPRSGPEAAYFQKALRTMSAIIRNCGFTYFYPPFEPRLWILYEITEYALTCEGGLPKTPDIELFLQHIDEMFKIGVPAMLLKHGYRCSYKKDRQHLLSWLELLVLLRSMNFNIDSIRTIMDNMTWRYTCEIQMYQGVELHKFEGTLIINGKMYTFTPFPR